jgi:hypothetical protein
MDNDAKVPHVKKRYVFVPVGIAGMLAFGLFSGGPLVSMDDYGDGLGGSLQPIETLDSTSSTFGGEPVTVKGGITVETTKLKAFSPTDTTMLEKGDRPQMFDVTITNNTPKKIDLFNLAIIKTDIEGDDQGVCSDLFDEEQGLIGVPWEPLKAGDSVTFPWGIGCPGDEGAKITITMAITQKDQVEFSGSLS